MAEDCADLPHRTLLRALDPRAIDNAARVFRALGDPGRLRVLGALLGGEACVGDIAGSLDEGMSTVSQRLRLLHADGLVARRRDGKHVHYTLADTHVVELLTNALAHAVEDRAGDRSAP